MRCADPVLLVLRQTPSDLERGRLSPLYDVETGRTESDQGQEETDTGPDGERDGTGNQTGEPLSETKDGEEEEDDSFQEDGGQSFSISDRSGTLSQKKPLDRERFEKSLGAPKLTWNPT